MRQRGPSAHRTISVLAFPSGTQAASGASGHHPGKNSMEIMLGIQNYHTSSELSLIAEKTDSRRRCRKVGGFKGVGTCHVPPGNHSTKLIRAMQLTAHHDHFSHSHSQIFEAEGQKSKRLQARRDLPCSERARKERPPYTSPKQSS